MKRKIALCLALMIAMMSLGAGALAATIKTNTSNGVVNLRSQGSAKKPVIGSVRNGAAVEILYRGNYWDKVRVSATGQEGWVYKKYVSEGGSSSAASVPVRLIATKKKGRSTRRTMGEKWGVPLGITTARGVATRKRTPSSPSTTSTSPPRCRGSSAVPLMNSSS